MARRPMGPKIAEHVDGSESAKARLEVILSTISGELSVAEACSKLGIGESAFHAMRASALQAAAESLEPKPAGRPTKPPPTEAEEKLLRAEQDLRIARVEVQAARLRQEIAAVMPSLLHRGSKKNRKR